MKHTYTIILALLLVVALAVPASASVMDNQGNEFPDFTELWNTSEYPYAIISYDSYNNAPQLSFFTKNTCVKISGKLDFSEEEVRWLSYSLSDNEWTKHPASGGVISGLYTDKVYWANFDIYDSKGSVWFATYPLSFPVCDGSSCPANDANADDVCDDCGKMLKLLSPEYPTFPDVPGTYKHYVLSRASSGRYDYTVFKSENAFTARGERADIYEAKLSRVVTIYRYSSSNGGDWVLNVDGVTNDTFTVGATGYLDVLDSSFSWYDENGAPFFPPPLWEEMGQVTQGEMGALTSQTTKTISILVLCGVGCLALLILLNLLVRKSQIFHL